MELGRTLRREEVRLGGWILRKAVGGNRRGHGGRAGWLDRRGRMARPDAVTLGLMSRDVRVVPVTVGPVVVTHCGRGTGMQRLHGPSPEAGSEQQQEQRNQSSALD